ncbi:hypothetical protein OPIT5_09190 [Opitutaceae bacterium TAV5]|nr:hypothetical protein OPIT5_09190 [Opitutaceae bacterium TAV5]
MKAQKPSCLPVRIKTSLVVTAAVVIFSSAQAANRYFSVTDGDWSASGNWESSNLPGSADTATVGQSDANSTRASIAHARINAGDNISITRLTIGNVGANGTSAEGTVTMTGGTLGISGYLLLAETANTSGTFTLSGGTVSMGNTIFLNRGGGSKGAMNVSGGTINGTSLYVGGTNGSSSATTNAELNVSGGSILLNDIFRIAHGNSTGNSTGVVNHTAGLISASGVEVQSANGGSGTYNLSGGELRIGTGGNNGQLRGGGAGTRAFNWSGGTIGVGDSSLLTVANSLGSLNLLSGGSDAVFDTTNTNAAAARILVQSSITGDGNLTIRGIGTVEFANSVVTYTGDTTVESGTLLLNASSPTSVKSANVLVGSVATLGGNGSFTGLVTANGKLAAGGVGSVGTLTFDQLLTLGDATIQWDFVDTANADLYTITGGIDFSGGDPVQISINALAGSTVNENDTFTIFQGDVSGIVASNFVVQDDLAAWQGNWKVRITGDSVQLVAVAIPEPSTCAFALGGIAALVLCIRRFRM